MGNGHWTRANTEPCILATRGKPHRVSKGVRQLIVAPVGRHSAKPREIHSRIEALVDGPYLELFGRELYPGWTVLGNEIDGLDMVEALRLTAAASEPPAQAPRRLSMGPLFDLMEVGD